LPRKEKRHGAANLQDSEDVTKPLPETNLREEIDHFGDSEKLGSSCGKKQAAGQNLQNPDDGGQTLARWSRDHCEFSIFGYLISCLSNDVGGRDQLLVVDWARMTGNPEVSQFGE
jgi:hypothetical protein